MMVRVVILEPYDGILMLKLSQLKCNLFTVQIFYLDLKRQTPNGKNGKRQNDKWQTAKMAKMANGKMTKGEMVNCKAQKWQTANGNMNDLKRQMARGSHVSRKSRQLVYQ